MISGTIWVERARILLASSRGSGSRLRTTMFARLGRALRVWFAAVPRRILAAAKSEFLRDNLESFFQCACRIAETSM